MWVTIGKVALLAFLVVAVLVFVAVLIYKARARGGFRYQDPITYGALGGAMPPTPLPDWANEADDPDAGQDFPKR